ncbi:MAG: hypothetical protein ACTHMM_17710 [Agriterribacter sp.]
MRKHLTILSLLFVLVSNAQPTSIYEEITNPNGTVNTWTFLPANYNSSNKYPWMCFVPGSGEIGTGTFSTDSTRIYKYGPGRARKLGTWNGRMKFRQLDGSSVDTPVIVTLLQPRSVTTSKLNTRHMDSVIKRYSVDTMRMIGTGLSMGGQMWNMIVMSYSGTTNPAITYDHYTWWSAVIPFSTPGPTSGAEIDSLHLWLDKGGLYYYGIGADDGALYIRKSSLAALKAAYPGQVFANEYPGEDHCCWQNRYNGTYLDPDSSLNIYDMAGLRDKYPKALAEDTIWTDGSAAIIHGKIAGYAAVYSYAQNSGPNTATITDNGDTTATISNLVNGTYQIRLRSRNGGGSSASYFDHVTTIIKTNNGKPPMKTITTKQAGQKINWQTGND